MRIILFAFLIAPFIISAQTVNIKEARIDGDFILPNTVPPLDYDSYFKFKTQSKPYIPVKDLSFIEHERSAISTPELEQVEEQF